MSGIRPLVEDDIPAVVSLRRRCFRDSAQASDAALGDYIHTLCFSHPWPRENLPSLVYEGKDGAIAAFLGVLPRPMQYQGERLWMAVSSQFMADPSQSGLIAIKLLKTFLAGPQDLSMSDLVNDNSRKVWRSLGAQTVYSYSQNWYRPLRPMAYRAARAGKNDTVSMSLARVLDKLLPALPGYRFVIDEATAGDCSEPVDAAGLADCQDEMSTLFALQPEYTPANLEWLLARVRDDDEVTDLVTRRVVEKSGLVLGWYIYTLNNDGLADVIQIFASEANMRRVVTSLMQDAFQRGAVALNGRLQPESQRAIAAQPVELARSGPWMMLDSRRPELRQELLAGGAFLSRLEGEWWMHF